MLNMNSQRIDQAVTEKRALVLGEVDSSTIQQMEEQLGIHFSEDYKFFLKQYGAASIEEHEVFGHAPSTHLDVVENTIQERKRASVLGKMIVLENPGYDGILIVMDDSGQVYEFNNQELKVIHTSFENYLENILN